MKKIKSGDKVQVITGKQQGVISVVDKVIDDYVQVKGVNIVKKAVKGKGFVQKVKPIHVSNVMIYCSTCKKAVRINRIINDQNKKIRICVKCKTEIK